MNIQRSRPLSPISDREMDIINKILIFPMPKPAFDVIPQTPSPPRTEPVPPLMPLLGTPPSSPPEISTPQIFQQIEQRMKDLFGEDTPTELAQDDDNHMLAAPPLVNKRTNSIFLRRNRENKWSTVPSPDKETITPEPKVSPTNHSPDEIDETSKEPIPSTQDDAPKIQCFNENIASQSTKTDIPKKECSNKKSISIKSIKNIGIQCSAVEVEVLRSSYELSSKKQYSIKIPYSAKSTKDVGIQCSLKEFDTLESIKDIIPKIQYSIQKQDDARSSEGLVLKIKCLSLGRATGKAPKIVYSIMKPGSSRLNKFKISKIHRSTKAISALRPTESKVLKTEEPTIKLEPLQPPNYIVPKEDPVEKSVHLHSVNEKVFIKENPSEAVVPSQSPNGDIPKVSNVTKEPVCSQLANKVFKEENSNIIPKMEDLSKEPVPFESIYYSVPKVDDSLKDSIPLHLPNDLVTKIEDLAKELDPLKSNEDNIPKAENLILDPTCSQSFTEKVSTKETFSSLFAKYRIPKMKYPTYKPIFPQLANYKIPKIQNSIRRSDLSQFTSKNIKLQNLKKKPARLLLSKNQILKKQNPKKKPVFSKNKAPKKQNKIKRVGRSRSNKNKNRKTKKSETTQKTKDKDLKKEDVTEKPVLSEVTNCIVSDIQDPSKKLVPKIDDSNKENAPNEAASSQLTHQKVNDLPRIQEQSEKRGSRSPIQSCPPKHPRMSAPENIPLIKLGRPEKQNEIVKRILLPHPAGGLHWITVRK